MSFRIDESASGLERITQAADYIFSDRSGLTVARVALAEGEAEVVLGGETSVEPGQPAALVVGLARHASGLVVYEHHLDRWRDTDSSLSMFQLTQVGTSMPVRQHSASCMPNLGQHDCIRFEVSSAEGSVQIPKYNYGTEHAVSHTELPESGRLGVARMVERFTTEVYGEIVIGARIQEALIVMGGAETVFRDPAMRAFAKLVD